MMDIALDEVIFFDAVTSDSSGAAVDADSTPTFSVLEEATDTPILADQNFTKRTSLTGNYRGTATLSAANGFEVGKWYSIVASATVDSVAGKAVIKNFRVVPAEASAGVPKVDPSHWRGEAIPATNQTGVPVVDIEYVDGTGVDPAGTVDANVVSFDAGAITAAAIADDAFTAAKFATGAFTADAFAANSLVAASFAAGAFDAVWTVAARILTAGTNIVLAKGTGVTGFNDLSAAQVNAEADTALADYDGPTNAEMVARTLAAADYATNTDLDALILTVGVAGAGLTALAQASVCTESRLAELDPANLPADIDTLKADGPNKPTRGVQLSNLPFLMVDETDFATPETGVTVTATISKDGGAFSACANAAAEIGNGVYKITLSSTEMDAASIVLKLTGTGCAQTTMAILTQPT